MLDAREIEIYRRMSPGERFALALELSDLAWTLMDVSDKETGDRKWAAWNREHDLSNEALLAALARLERPAGGGTGEP